MYPNATNKLIEKELSYKVVGLLYQIHKEYGRYLKEKQYGDVLEGLLKDNCLEYEREKATIIEDRKSNFIDFCIANKILIELKAKSFITKEDYYQMQRYLTSENKELGLIVNFRQRMLRPKRVINYSLKNSENSDKFVV
jgi:GxxExxY protein